MTAEEQAKFLELIDAIRRTDPAAFLSMIDEAQLERYGRMLFGATFLADIKAETFRTFAPKMFFLVAPLRPDGDRLPPADANLLEALDDALTAKGDVVGVPKWTFDYVRRLVERLRRPALVALLLLATATPSAALLAKFTPPDPAWTTCQLMIGVSVVAPQVLPAAPCVNDPANVCVHVPLTLAPGHYPFQLVCTTGLIGRSNIVRVDVP